MARSSLSASVLILGLASLAPGCQRDAGTPLTSRPQSTPKVPPAKKVPADGIQTYKLTGVVRRVDPASGLVTISHDAIPDFMEAMTMPFTLKDHSLLDEVRVGDGVEGSLRVERAGGEVKDYELTDLVVARPAPAAPLKLDLSGLTSPALKPGDLVPDFAMTGQDGKAFRLSDLRGNVVALTFIYTRCPLPDFCPRLDTKFSEASQRAEVTPEKAARLRFLSISFDPEHDTPAVLSQHAKARGARPPLWSFAVASHDELAKVAAPLGLQYGPGKAEVIHNLVIAVIGPDGRLVRKEVASAAREWATADLIRTMFSCVSEVKP